MRKIYFSDRVDPGYNLAVEEYLLGQAASEDDILFLWQNDKTVVIGRNQNPWKECDLDVLEQKGCRLVRRLSGGGAVYHDLGNLNFTFISRFHPNCVRDNIEIVINAIRSYGIDAVFSGKNDIQVGAFKVSGNAYFEQNNFICHHGTLLLDSDLSQLATILTASKLKLESKGINSVKARVINLKALNPAITVPGFKQALVTAFTNRPAATAEPNHPERSSESVPETIPADNESFLTAADRQAIAKIETKYHSWDWNYGASPAFNVAIARRYEWGEVELLLVVNDGIIDQIAVSTDALDVDLANRIKNGLIATAFDEKQIFDRIIPAAYQKCLNKSCSALSHNG